MLKSTPMTSAALLASVAFSAWIAAPSQAAVLFSSDFSGAELDPLSASPQWLDAWNSGAAADTRISGNQGYLTNSAATGFPYEGVKAEASGSPAMFNPADQLRFQIDLDRMTDSRSRTTENIYFIQYLTPANLTVQPYNATPERLILFAIYNKKSGTNSTIDLSLQQAKGSGSGNGQGLWNVTIPVNGTIETAQTDPAHTIIQLAVELRNDAAGDVRAGYQQINGGVPQGWNYSNWYNVEGGTYAFDANWASNWAGNTQWYLEIGGAPASGGTSETWVDNAVVTSVPEPAVLSLLGLGALALIRRRKA